MLLKWRCLRAEKNSKNLVIQNLFAPSYHPQCASDNFSSRGIGFKQRDLILPSKDFRLGALISMTFLKVYEIFNAKCSSNGHPEIKLSSNSEEIFTPRNSRLVNLSNPLKEGGGSIIQPSRIRCFKCKHVEK